MNKPTKIILSSILMSISALSHATHFACDPYLGSGQNRYLLVGVSFTNVEFAGMHHARISCGYLKETQRITTTIEKITDTNTIFSPSGPPLWNLDEGRTCRPYGYNVKPNPEATSEKCSGNIIPVRRNQ